MSVCSKFFFDIKHRCSRHRKLRASDVKSNQVVLVSCNNINKRFKEYAVETTHKEIMDTINYVESELKKDKREIWIKQRNDKLLFKKLSHRKMLENQFNQITYNVNKYSDEQMNDNYEKKNQAFKDWCDDAVLYHCYNKVLNGIMINAKML